MLCGGSRPARSARPPRAGSPAAPLRGLAGGGPPAGAPFDRPLHYKALVHGRGGRGELRVQGALEIAGLQNDRIAGSQGEKSAAVSPSLPAILQSAILQLRTGCHPGDVDLTRPGSRDPVLAPQQREGVGAERLGVAQASFRVFLRERDSGVVVGQLARPLDSREEPIVRGSE